MILNQSHHEDWDYLEEFGSIFFMCVSECSLRQTMKVTCLMFLVSFSQEDHPFCDEKEGCLPKSVCFLCVSTPVSMEDA